MIDNECKQNEQLQKSCSYCFSGPRNGVCDAEKEIYNQAESGGLTEKDWEAYIKRMAGKPLKGCLFPEQINGAINNAEPKLVDSYDNKTKP